MLHVEHNVPCTGTSRLMSREILYKDFVIRKEDEIVVISPMNDTCIEVRDILKFREIAKELTNSDKQLLLTDTRGKYVGVSGRAQKLLARSFGESDNRIAEAYVTDSLPMKIIVNHYVNAKQPRNPTCSFDTIESAKQWLLEFIEN